MEFWLIIVCLIAGFWALGQIANYFEQRKKAQIERIKGARWEIAEAKEKIEAHKRQNEQDKRAVDRKSVV